MIIGISGKKGSGKNTVANIIQTLVAYHKHAEEFRNNTVEDIVSKGDSMKLFITHNSGWKQKSFAFKVKQIASILTGIPIEKFEDQEFKKTVLPIEWTKHILTLEDQYACRCNNCHWIGNCDELQGGGQIADTGDYSDTYCPKCFSTDINEIDPEVTMTVRELLQKIGTEAIRDNIHSNAWVNALFTDYKPLNLLHNISSEGIIPTNFPNWIITDCRFPNEAQAIKDRQGIIIRLSRDTDDLNDQHPSETALDNYKEFDYTIQNNGTIKDLINQVELILQKEKIFT